MLEAATLCTCFHLKSLYYSFPLSLFFTLAKYLLLKLSSSHLPLTLLLPIARQHTALISPPPPQPTPPLHCSPFTVTVFVALIANESQDLSMLGTCTTYLCVGQCLKDESLSTQRLYMHAFELKNTEPESHPSRDC